MKYNFFFLLALVLPLFGMATPADFFDEADAFFRQHVDNGRVDYQAIASDRSTLNSLIEQIGSTDPATLSGDNRKAYLINSYNLLVVNQVVSNLPLKSPLDVSGFFDGNKFNVGGQRMTLNQLEKNLLLREYEDARLHFVLVCAAVGCPPLIAEAYRPATLEAQLERQTRRALNNPSFIRVTGDQVKLSQIFEWYTDDFGGNKAAVVDYINRYRNATLPSNNFTFYNYNWQLNQTQNGRSSTTELPTLEGNNSARYVVSAAIPKGGFEIKGFSNLYTQQTNITDSDPDGQRATFFTQQTSVLYGITNRFNAGIDLRYRQVNFGPGTNSQFDVFNLENDAANRQGLTGIGPKIRYAPFEALPNFSVQSTYYFSTDNTNAGTADRPFIDFNGDIWWTQFFNDFPLGQNFSAFAELDVWWEDIGPSEEGHINRFSTPVIGILSYFPNPKTTLYTIGSYSPYWQEDFDYFYQYGLGAKYQVTPKFELELLYTEFRNPNITDTNGTASTLNFGVRISTF